MAARLLLADDEPDVRAIARLSLERVGGYEVVDVDSGAAALEAVRNQGPFDVVVLDVMMPDLDGPATLSRLRAGILDDDVPIVFLTAKVQPADRARLAGLGAAGVLAKPFDPVKLPGELRDILLAA